MERVDLPSRRYGFTISTPAIQRSADSGAVREQQCVRKEALEREQTRIRAGINNSSASWITIWILTAEPSKASHCC
jgi:hypothetical protein